MPRCKEREYRSMPVMAVTRAEGEEAPSYRVRGYASTFNEPYALMEGFDGKEIFEQVDPHAFDEADMSDVIMQYDHMGMVYARTKNGSLKLGVDDHGLWIDADLGLTDQSKQLYEAISTGLVDQMSFCFIIEDEQFDQKTRTWTVSRIGKVYDVSAVSIPANPGTEISIARKQLMDGEIRREQAERLAKLHEQRKRKIQILRLKVKIAAGKGEANGF